MTVSEKTMWWTFKFIFLETELYCDFDRTICFTNHLTNFKKWLNAKKKYTFHKYPFQKTAQTKRAKTLWSKYNPEAKKPGVKYHWSGARHASTEIIHFELVDPVLNFDTLYLFQVF